MNAQTALRATRIAADELLGIALQCEALSALKRRCARLETDVNATETELIHRFDDGAVFPAGYEVVIAEKSIRHVSWRSEFCAVAGNEAAKAALERTIPCVYRTLIIKKAA